MADTKKSTTTTKKSAGTKNKTAPNASQMAVRRQMWGAGYLFFAFLLLLHLYADNLNRASQIALHNSSPPCTQAACAAG